MARLVTTISLLFVGLISSVEGIAQSELASNDSISSYDVLIFEGNMEELKKEARHFNLLYPNLEKRIRYEAPFYKLKVGDCGSKQDAEELKEKLKTDYPKGSVEICGENEFIEY